MITASGPPSIAPLLTLSNTWLHPQYCDPTIKTTVYSGHEALEVYVLPDAVFGA
jgi:hypothetical protein